MEPCFGGVKALLDRVPLVITRTVPAWKPILSQRSASSSPLLGRARSSSCRRQHGCRPVRPVALMLCTWLGVETRAAPAWA